MRKEKRVQSPENSGGNILGSDAVDIFRRISNLLALILVKGQNQTQQIITLNNAGFSPKDIALLLDTTSNNVNVRLSENRARRKKKEEKEK